MSARHVDRYALVSSADPLDRAWISLGWSPALEGERASALRDAVPWPSVTAGLDDPAWLRGAVEEVLSPSNWDRLDFAFLPLDGRLSLSVWGAVGPRVEATREWRVLTHTLLFDRDLFEAMAGNPFALMRSAGVPAEWFRELTAGAPLAASGPLDPVAVPRGQQALRAFRLEHLREVAALRARLLPAYGGDVGKLEDALARVYEALRRTFAGDVRTVTLRARDDGHARLLTRLAWLSLPPDDRAEVFFTTQQRRATAPAVTLAVLPEDEWGGLAPAGSVSLDDVPPPPSGGRRLWASMVANHSGEAAARTVGGSGLTYPGLLRRAETRRWRILARDDLGAVAEQAAWSDRWSRAGDDRALAGELLDLERGRGPRAGGPRWRAAGHVLALAERAGPAPASADGAVTAAGALVGRLRTLPPEHAAAVTSGLVRTLARGGDAWQGVAGLVRCRAASGETPATPRPELLRLLDREAGLLDALLRDAFGPPVLFRAAAELARTGEDRVGPLLGHALAAMDDTADAVEWLRRTLRLRDPVDATLARDVLVLGEETRPGHPPDPARLGEWMLAGLEDAPPDGRAADALKSWLLRPAVVSWFLEDAAGPAMRRWLAATAVPADRIADHYAAAPAGRLPRVIAIAIELGHARTATGLLADGLRHHAAEPWAELVDGFPSAWLRDPATLAVLEGATTAVSVAAVRRIAAELGGDTLAPPQADGILRLLWRERQATGDSASIHWIERELPRYRAIPVLARLFVALTPLELGSELRAALLRLVAGVRGRVETGVAAAALRARAPAVADAAEGVQRGHGRLIFLSP